MKIDVTKILLIIIIILMGLLAWRWNKPAEVIINTIETVNTDTVRIPGDSIIVTVYSAPIYLKDTVFDTMYIQEQVDTSTVIQDYYTTKVFTDLRVLGDYGYISITDYVRKNSIFHRVTDVNISTIQKIITTTKYNTEIVNVPMAGMYIGGVLTLTNNYWGFYITGEYVTKNGGSYEIGYDPFHKGILLGTKLNLFKW